MNTAMKHANGHMVCVTLKVGMYGVSVWVDHDPNFEGNSARSTLVELSHEGNQLGPSEETQGAGKVEVHAIGDWETGDLADMFALAAKAVRIAYGSDK